MKSFSRLALLALIATAGPGLAADTPLQGALTGDHRPEMNSARDGSRHPAQTLEFFGLRSDMTVVELWPGGGWYTEILAPVLRHEGKLMAATYGDTGDSSEYRTRSHRAYMEKLAARPDVYDAVEVITFWPAEAVSLGPDNSADLVLTFRNIHSMIRRDQQKEFFAAAWRVLKAGGVLGIVQHRAPDDADPKTSADHGYVPQAYVISLATEAGFSLAGSSEVNANPKDTKDHPEGVWTLPPSLRLEDTDRERYLAIGESDRMTLKFVKPGLP
jgi:predicted methyltransferase